MVQVLKMKINNEYTKNFMDFHHRYNNNLSCKERKKKKEKKTVEKA